MLYKTIHSTKSTAKCSNLRSLFKQFDQQYGIAYPKYKLPVIEWTHTQQEPTDVANILMRVFDLPQDVKLKLVSKTTKRTEMRSFNSPFIDIGELKSKRIVYMKDYIPETTETFTQENGKSYTKVTSIINAKLLQVNVVRNFLDEEKVTTPVIPLESLNFCLPKKECTKVLSCSSVLIHHGHSPKGGHYTCMIKRYSDGLWYHYDDLHDSYVKIGNFAQMLKWKNGYVCKNLVSCVYM
jgi:uncharacterized UBP type Zn finger protein